MKIKKIQLKQLIKEIVSRTVNQLEARSGGNSGWTVPKVTYGDIGHYGGGYLWWWKDGDLKIEKPSTYKGHLSYKIRADFEGRYDPDKHIVSLVDMGYYRNHGGSQVGEEDPSLNNVPSDLIRRLRDEFGDDVQIKKFTE